jgi:hypothetical protein
MFFGSRKSRCARLARFDGQVNDQLENSNTNASHECSCLDFVASVGQRCLTDKFPRLFLLQVR